MTRLTCAHCGLPVIAGKDLSGNVFCCYGCYLVHRIVGDHEGQGSYAWSILRLGIGALLAMNVMSIALLLYTGQLEAATITHFRWAMLALATPAMFLLGYPFFQGAAGEIARRQLSLDTLIAVGSSAAFIVSAFNTIRGFGHVYFDTAAMLPALVTFGRIVEATAKTRTGRLIHTLETLLPRTALRVENGNIHEIDIALLRTGDLVRVRPGERIAADGPIVEGNTIIQEAAFTGEFNPRECGPGDSMIAGTVNGHFSFVMRAERVGEDLLLRRIIDLVAQARDAAAPWEGLAARYARFFTPAVLGLAVAAGLAWYVMDGAAKAGFVALAVLVVACPCAMVIATPLATAVAIGRAARAGIIVRGGDVLERIASMKVIFFDKTGTLTTNEPAITRVELSTASVTEEELFGRLAALETGSEHPLAKVIVAEARRRGIEIGHATNLRISPGKGLRGLVTWQGIEHDVSAGTEQLMLPAAGATRHAGTTVNVTWDGRIHGRISFSDNIRTGAKEAVGVLRDDGVQTVMLSGDNKTAAQALGDRLVIDAVHAECSPDRKIEIVRAALNPEHAVAMVGDGINDAPALAAADIGIALGAGTDLARQSGNVILLSDRLTQIPWLVALSRRTRQIIRQNLLWAFGYNGVALAAAAMGLLHPLIAAVAMLASSLTVLGNSLRLQRFPDA